MTLAFWIALTFVVYTYAGYPLAIWMMARVRKESPLAEGTPNAGWPALSIVIAVHNEAARVPAKLNNLRGLDYPRNLMKFVFVSDGSTDGTDNILAAQTDVKLIRHAERQGKPQALNAAMREIDTPVVVFADVRQTIGHDALRCLVRRLLEPGVGAVSAELVHVDPQNRTAAHIGLYWRYEKWIRRSESAVASTVGATGALYALRYEDFTPLAPDTLLDDFEQPMLIARRGKRVLFEPRAVMFDELQSDMAGEFKRKVRTLTGNFQSFARHPWMFSPYRNPLWVQFISHKVFRLLVPYALAIVLITALFGPTWSYRVLGLAQLCFYAMALAGRWQPSLRNNRLVSFSTVFVEMNWASVLGLRNWLAGGLNARWEKT